MTSDATGSIPAPPQSNPTPPKPIPDFTLVPRLHNRHDGWGAARQRGFIAVLAQTGLVTAAATFSNREPLIILQAAK